MKCPLLEMGLLSAKGLIGTPNSDCLKEECAWWDEPVKRCLWLNVSEKLSFIYLELDAIAKELTLVRGK